jgi:hypothetical protein
MAMVTTGRRQIDGERVKKRIPATIYGRPFSEKRLVIPEPGASAAQ